MNRLDRILIPEQLINLVSLDMLISQHDKIIKFRNYGWNFEGKIIDKYLMKYNQVKLYRFHELIISRLEKNGYKIDKKWKNCYFDGRKDISYEDISIYGVDKFFDYKDRPIYKEHNKAYLDYCSNILEISTTGIDVKEEYNDFDGIHTFFHTNSKNIVDLNGYISHNQLLIKNNKQVQMLIEKNKKQEKISLYEYFINIMKYNGCKIIWVEPIKTFNGLYY